jgi:hypothetical protein
LLSSIQIVKEEYVLAVERKFRKSYEEIIQAFEGYLKIIEKFEKCEKIDKLTKLLLTFIQDISNLLKEAKDQHEVFEIVWKFQNQVAADLFSFVEQKITKLQYPQPTWKKAWAINWLITCFCKDLGQAAVEADNRFTFFKGGSLIKKSHKVTIIYINVKLL